MTGAGSGTGIRYGAGYGGRYGDCATKCRSHAPLPLTAHCATIAVGPDLCQVLAFTEHQMPLEFYFAAGFFILAAAYLIQDYISDFAEHKTTTLLAFLVVILAVAIGANS